MIGGHPLRDPPTHRRAVDIDPIHAQLVEDGDHVGRETPGAVLGVRFVAAPRAPVVERDGAEHGVEVGADRIPPVVVVRLSGQQHEDAVSPTVHLVVDGDVVGSECEGHVRTI